MGPATKAIPKLVVFGKEDALNSLKFVDYIKVRGFLFRPQVKEDLHGSIGRRNGTLLFSLRSLLTTQVMRPIWRNLQSLTPFYWSGRRM
jgi:hypothetical protein